MKNNTLPLAIVILSLMMSSLACGLSTASGTNTTEGSSSTVEPSLEVQPAGETPTAASSSGQEATPLAVMPTLMPVPDINGDGKIDICEAVPAAVWETVIGRPQNGKPAPFKDPALGDGCAFDFGKDAKAAYFSYVTFATEKQFNDTLASATRPEPVTTIGDSAFLNYGPDARQLWVRSGDKAVMVAIGDQENVGGMVLVAPYLLQAVVQQ
jgi:hypothetical protein